MTLSKLLLFLILVGGIFSYYFILPQASLLYEKYSLKPPKDLSKPSVGGISISSESGKYKYSQDYTIVLVGDSMTEILGNADELRGYLKEYYPNKTFEILNYGFGATSILSVPDRLTKQTLQKREYRPIQDIEYDLIILESFGHNPLSEFPLKEGLEKQEQMLDTVSEILSKDGSYDKLVYMATIAPNTDIYGAGQVDLKPDVRRKWANERSAYIENHIKYANSHNIPLINIYQKSTEENGNGKIIYVNKADGIHPSPTGVLLISKVIADTIYDKNLLHINP